MDMTVKEFRKEFMAALKASGLSFPKVNISTNPKLAAIYYGTARQLFFVNIHDGHSQPENYIRYLGFRDTEALRKACRELEARLGVGVVVTGL